MVQCRRCGGRMDLRSEDGHPEAVCWMCGNRAEVVVVTKPCAVCATAKKVTCGHCKRTFRTPGGNAQYCGGRCRSAAFRERRRAAAVELQRLAVL